MTQLYYTPHDAHQHIMQNTQKELPFEPNSPSEWKQQLRNRLKQQLGYPNPEKVDFNHKTLWKKKVEHGTIEKFVFTSEPYSDVPAYLCIPDNVKPPYKTLICLGGHSKEGMLLSIGGDPDGPEITVEGDRDYALQCLKNGFAALCIEQRGFGERSEPSVKGQPCYQPVNRALMLGRTLAGERIFDVQRAIEYLYTRSDIDFSCLGVMGNSAGGTTGLYAAALLDEITFAVPSCCFGDFASSRMAIEFCTCSYVPGMFTLAEMSDIAGLIAPRPLILVAGENDRLFPIESVHKAYEDTKKIYAHFRAEQHCHLLVGQEGHRFYADLAWPVIHQERQLIAD